RPLEELDERLRVRLMDLAFGQICYVEPPRSLALQRLGALPPRIARMRFENFVLERRGATREQEESLRQALDGARRFAANPVGWQSGTAWAQEKLYQLFNYRYNFNLPTVVTTNLLLEALEPRLSSRLSEAALLRVTADDFRRAGGTSRPNTRNPALRESAPRSS